MVGFAALTTPNDYPLRRGPAPWRLGPFGIFIFGTNIHRGLGGVSGVASGRPHHGVVGLCLFPLLLWAGLCVFVLPFLTTTFYPFPITGLLSRRRWVAIGKLGWCLGGCAFRLSWRGHLAFAWAFLLEAWNDALLLLVCQALFLLDSSGWSRGMDPCALWLQNLGCGRPVWDVRIEKAG